MTWCEENLDIDRGWISMEIFWVGYICIFPPRNRQSVHLKIHPFQIKGNSSSKPSFWGFQLLALVFYYFLFDPWFLGSTSEPNSETEVLSFRAFWYSVSVRFGRSKKLRLRWFTQDAWGVLKQEDKTQMLLTCMDYLLYIRFKNNMNKGKWPEMARKNIPIPWSIWVNLIAFWCWCLLVWRRQYSRMGSSQTCPDRAVLLTSFFLVSKVMGTYLEDHPL